MQTIMSSKPKDIPTVVVMMATYNGDRFIEEQIRSITNQEDVKVILYVRDDGSSDHTVEILKKYVSSDKILFGNHDGSADNFWNLLQHVERVSQEQYYAWSDQDDIWDSNKLITAIKALEQTGENLFEKPALYSSNNRKIDSYGNIIRTQASSRIHLSALPQVLVKSNVQGATMVFNRKLLAFAANFTPKFKEHKLYHDAWINKLCFALNGVVVYDKIAHISYRIHQDNVLGKVQHKTTFWKQLVSLFNNNNPDYSYYVANTLLSQYQDYLSEESKSIIGIVAGYKRNKRYKAIMLFTNMFSTGNRSVDLKFKFAVLVNKA